MKLGSESHDWLAKAVKLTSRGHKLRAIGWQWSQSLLRSARGLLRSAGRPWSWLAGAAKLGRREPQAAISSKVTELTGRSHRARSAGAVKLAGGDHKSWLAGAVTAID